MTRNYVHILLARAVIMSVEAGMKTVREAGPHGVTPEQVKEITGAAIANAAAFVMPAVELLQDEATETALIEACNPYAEALHTEANVLKTQTPATNSPLFSVWLHGMFCAFDAVAKEFGGTVDVGKAADNIDDGSDMVEAIAVSLVRQSREMVLQ